MKKRRRIIIIVVSSVFIYVLLVYIDAEYLDEGVTFLAILRALVGLITVVSSVVAIYEFVSKSSNRAEYIENKDDDYNDYLRSRLRHDITEPYIKLGGIQYIEKENDDDDNSEPITKENDDDDNPEPIAKENDDDDNSEPITYDDIRIAVKSLRQFVLLSEPGGGKSTTLKYIAEALAEKRLGVASERNQWLDNLYSEAQGYPIPLYINLGDSESPTDVSEMLQYHWSKRNSLPGRAQKQIERRKVFLLLDGLDELPEKFDTDRSLSRRDRVKAIEIFLKKNKEIRAVVTCRNAEFNQMSLNLPIIRINRLGFPQVENYVHEWFKIAQKNRESWGRKSVNKLLIALRNNTTLRQLSSNPFYLATMVELYFRGYDLPNDIANLYSNYYSNAYHSREAEPKLSEIVLKKKLSKLSFAMLEKKNATEVEWRWARRQIRKRALRDGRFIGILVIQDAQSTVSFYHSSIQVFFALEKLIAKLKRIREPEKKRNIIMKLEALGGAAAPAAEVLVNELRNKKVYVSNDLILALGEQAASPLINLLRHGETLDGEVQNLLLRLGEDGVGALSNVLKDDESIQLQRTIISLLGNIGGTKARNTLLFVAETDQHPARIDAINALSSIPPESQSQDKTDPVETFLLSLLAQGNEEEVVAAATSLGKIGSKKTLELLAEMLKNTEQKLVVLKVASAIVAIGVTYIDEIEVRKHLRFALSVLRDLQVKWNDIESAEAMELETSISRVELALKIKFQFLPTLEH